jgi:hypothetical protein
VANSNSFAEVLNSLVVKGILVLQVLEGSLVLKINVSDSFGIFNFLGLILSISHGSSGETLEVHDVLG